MGKNLLITGAAGYIGGSVLANFVNRSLGSIINKANISIIVRSENQVQRLDQLGVNVIQADLLDEAAVHDAVHGNEIDVIIHLASSHDPRIVSFLIKALGDRRKSTGVEAHFIHTSGTTAFAPEAGWPDRATKDTSEVYQIEKSVASENPIRLTDIQVIEEGRANSVATYIIVVPSVYGRGTGEIKRMSIAFPTFVRASIKNKMVHRYDRTGKPGAAHISDIVALYGILVERILQNEPIPRNDDGYYFAVAHTIPSQDLMQQMAKHLYALGLVAEPRAHIWPSDELAAASLGVPPQIGRLMGTHSTELVPVRPYQLGWQPQWNEDRLLLNLGQEIQEIVESDAMVA